MVKHGFIIIISPSQSLYSGNMGIIPHSSYDLVLIILMFALQKWYHLNFCFSCGGNSIVYLDFFFTSTFLYVCEIFWHPTDIPLLYDKYHISVYKYFSIPLHLYFTPWWQQLTNERKRRLWKEWYMHNIHLLFITSIGYFL